MSSIQCYLCDYEKQEKGKNGGLSADGQRPGDPLGSQEGLRPATWAPSWPFQAVKVCSERREASEALKCKVEGGGQLKIDCAGQAGQLQVRDRLLLPKAAVPGRWRRARRESHGFKGLPSPSQSQAPGVPGSQSSCHMLGVYPRHPGCCRQVLPVWPQLVYQQIGHSCRPLSSQWERGSRPWGLYLRALEAPAPS